MEKCTHIVVNWMIQCKVIDDVDKELYTYALNSFFLLVTPVILAGSIGLCVGSLEHGVVLILPFVFLRKFSGGYHAKRLSMCILGSSFLLALCIILSMNVKCDWKLIITTVIASVSLVIFSPMESANRKLDDDEKRIYKKAIVFLVMLFGFLDIILFCLGKYMYTVCFSIGTLLTAVLQIPCVVRKIYKSTKNII